MKTYLTYGAAMAVAGALLNLSLFFLGFHSDVSKLDTAQLIGTIVGLIVCVTCVVLGTRARRDEILPTVDFGYGSALGAGVMVVLFASLLGTVFNFVYFQFINPGFSDLIMQSQAAKMEGKGLSAAQIEQAQKMTAMFFKPAFQACFGFIFGMIFGTIVSLITAAFLKRAPSDTPPALG